MVDKSSLNCISCISLVSAYNTHRPFLVSILEGFCVLYTFTFGRLLEQLLCRISTQTDKIELNRYTYLTDIKQIHALLTTCNMVPHVLKDTVCMPWGIGMYVWHVQVCE